MTNITHLKLDALARRATGWHYGADELPLRSDDPTSLQADHLRAVSNVCPMSDPACVRFCARPRVCGNEPS